MHRYRMSFLAGLAAGYVLGTRAGRERYEQMKKLARTVADNPAVQQAAGAAQAQAAAAVTAASAKVSDNVRDRAKTARSKVEQRVPGLRHRSGHAANGNGKLHNGSSVTGMSFRSPGA